MTTIRVELSLSPCHRRWFDVGCLCLEDPVQAIHLEVYTQMTPIPNECVNQMRFETPIDYAFRSTGYSLTVGAVMSGKLSVSAEDWHQSYAGVTRQEILYNSGIALATLYKNRLMRWIGQWLRHLYRISFVFKSLSIYWLIWFSLVSKDFYERLIFMVNINETMFAIIVLNDSNRRFYSNKF